MARGILSALVVAGSGIVVYLYHVRTQQFDTSGRSPIKSWRPYEWVDWYLKFSTVVVTVAAINLDDGWLLKLDVFPSQQWIGIVVAGCGLLLFIAAMTTLNAQFSPAHQSQLPASIVTSGPYRWIRHPVYTANVVLMVGLLLVSSSAWLLINLVILIAFYVPTIKVEEAALSENFPEYREYANRTGRLFPRLRPKKRT